MTGTPTLAEIVVFVITAAVWIGLLLGGRHALRHPPRCPHRTPGCIPDDRCWKCTGDRAAP